MSIYKNNIEKKTINNTNYRKVVSTTNQIQLVLMSLSEGEEIGMETHPHTTQFIRVEKGTGVAIVRNKRFNLKENDAIIIPANHKHNIIATSDLKLYTIYSPPEHDKNLVQRKKV
jgi:mannose-6-phosphate isomerase-like protein (cupin superfamily)